MSLISASIAPTTFDIVVAATADGGIGKNGALPWRLPKEMARFRAITTGNTSGRTNAVIMGRLTYESIPARFRPLAGRVNVVLTHDPDALTPTLPQGVITAASLNGALDTVTAMGVERVFVIGGARVYKEALQHHACDGIYLTRVAGEFGADVFFPEIDETAFVPDETHAEHGVQHREGTIDYTYIRYVRK